MNRNQDPSSSSNNSPRPCIYRVPDDLRGFNPRAYTPQLVIIGPLHQKLKSQEVIPREDITNAKSMNYSDMEKHKKNYIATFWRRFEVETVFKQIIEESQSDIEASYSEKIEHEDFVLMILNDSVFILELLWQAFERREGAKTKDPIDPKEKGKEKITEDPGAEKSPTAGDPLVDDPWDANTIKRDLILLENQLPYFILEKLFKSIPKEIRKKRTLGELTMSYFGVGQINSKFDHFTDLYRCMRVNRLPKGFRKGRNDVHPLQSMHNADKLDSGGVKLWALENGLSLEVRFENDYLRIHPFLIDCNTEVTFTNIVALERRHYPDEAYFCKYINFLNHLIKTEKDVDLLVRRGIIWNQTGRNGLVAEILNNLHLGVETGKYYSNIVTQVIDRYYALSNKIDLELGLSSRMWLPLRDLQRCTIYRVPDNMRQVNPQAYTPQLVLIGPLHHSLKSQALNDITNTNSIYLNMEGVKEKYQGEFSQRVLGQPDIITQFKKIISDAEKAIRDSYSESTIKITSQTFVDMILEDSVFILQFLWKSCDRNPRAKTGDPLMHEYSLQSTIKRDLVLLENQLPFFILQRLYDAIPDEAKPRIPTFPNRSTFMQLICHYFGTFIMAEEEPILHFTDLLRANHERTLRNQNGAQEIPRNQNGAHENPGNQNGCCNWLGYCRRPSGDQNGRCNWLGYCWRPRGDQNAASAIPKAGWFCNMLLCFCQRPRVWQNRQTGNYPLLENMDNAEKLNSKGVRFQAVGEEPSLVVNFVGGYLQLPKFSISRNTEVRLRNMMALEQCHFPGRAHVCNYVLFLDFLIDTEKDVDLLVEKGILVTAGDSRVVADIVNKLCNGLDTRGSYYSVIAADVSNFYNSCMIGCYYSLVGLLSPKWKVFSMIAAAIVLAMTIGQFVVALKESKKNPGGNC